MSRKLYSGNEAIAQGAYEAGVGLVSSYPGTPSTEITENIAKYEAIYCEWATNEKVALEVVLGASLAGARALTAMKHVGLNVAADPMMTASYTGVNGGVVIVVADDPNMYSSQNEQDSRNYARMAKLPMLEPADSQEALDYVKRGFEMSEKYNCPVLLRSTTRVSHSMSIVERGERAELPRKAYEKNATGWVMTPVNARVRHRAVEGRLLALEAEAAELATVHMAGRELGIITSGAAYQYVREAMPEASVLKLGMVWPLPLDKIADFFEQVKTLCVIEELDPFIENELKAVGFDIFSLERSVCGELSVDAVQALFGIGVGATRPIDTDNIPVRLPNMCAGCSHRGIFYAISKLKLTVTGDIGCYTLGYMPPLAAMDSCVCMGASVSMAHGFDRGSSGATDSNLVRKAVGVIGDSTFMHTGINGLMNSAYNGGTSTIVILDNSITGMTGHQPNPGSGRTIRGQQAPKVDLEQICRAIGVQHVYRVDPFDIDKCIELLKQETAREAVSVIIAERPCIFVDKSGAKAPYEITEACSGCKMCLRLGCPAISWDAEKKKASIDDSMCNGCGLCPKVCRFGAIEQIEL